MSATDELRRLLDERGVEWSGKESTDVGNMTEWECGKTKAVAMEEDDGTLGLGATYLTPAQAIAATLGRGTCHLKPWEMERDTGFYDCMECDCGYVADVADWASWHFCPSCGRQNVGVDE